MSSTIMIELIKRLEKNHLSFIESYPEYIHSDEGRKYCVNNILREVASITTDISHHLIVEKDLTPDEAQDVMMILFTTSNTLLDRYNGRSTDWYEDRINELYGALQKEGE